MRLDRHEKLAGLLKLLRSKQKEYWERDKEIIPHYRLVIKPAPPRFMLGSICPMKAFHSRAVAAHVHWRMLQVLLKVSLPDMHKGAFIGNVVGFPEFSKVGDLERGKASGKRYCVPFRVSFEYQKQPFEWTRLGRDTSWLLAYNAIDLENPRWSDPREKLSEFEHVKAPMRASNWVIQTQSDDSCLFINRDQPTSPIWEEFICWHESIAARPVSSEPGKQLHFSSSMPFAPAETEKLGDTILKVRYFIQTNLSKHYDRLARAWLGVLIERLFFKTDLDKGQQATILGYFGIIDQDYIEPKMRGLILDLSSYPISYKRTAQILEVLYEEFLSDVGKKYKSGELLLLILIALQTAYRRPRFFCIREILGLTGAQWKNICKGFKIENRLLNVSAGLTEIIQAFVPMSEKQKRKIFSLSISWINQHLKEINTQLGYDWNNNPVTIQTFLARPYNNLEYPHRCKPRLWGIASNVRWCCYHKLFKSFQEAFLMGPLRSVKFSFAISAKKVSFSNLYISSFHKNFPPMKIEFKAFRMIVL